MMNKSKQLLIGFIIGVLVCSIIPVYSAVQEYILQLADYKLLVNGIEYNDAEYPILSYQGRTYIPLRKVADILGVKLKWNDELGQAEIIRDINTTKKSTSEEIDGFKVFTVDNKKYIEYSDLRIAFDNNYFYPYVLYVGKNFVQEKGNLGIINDETKEIIIDEIQLYTIKNRLYVELEYYLDKIQPIVKQGQ